MSEQMKQETEQASPDDVCNACGNPRRKHPMSWPKAWDGRGLHCGGDFGDDTPLSRVTHHAPASDGTPRGVVRDADEGAALVEAFDNAVSHNARIAGKEAVSAYHEDERMDEEGPRQALLAALRGTPAPGAAQKREGEDWVCPDCGHGNGGWRRSLECRNCTYARGTPAPTGGAHGETQPTDEERWPLIEHSLLVLAGYDGNADQRRHHREKIERCLTQMRAELAALRAAAPTGERAGGADAVTKALAGLRHRLRLTVMPTASNETPPLRDALIGQQSDSAFWTTWEGNKAALVRLLDAIDAAAQHAARAATPAREGALPEAAEVELTDTERLDWCIDNGYLTTATHPPGGFLRIPGRSMRDAIDNEILCEREQRTTAATRQRPAAGADRPEGA